METQEIWKTVLNYRVHYEISSFGRIRGNGKILKQYINKYGYHKIRISGENKRLNYQLHRLVAEFFIPNPLNKKFVNHINCNKSDNRVENLEWVTWRENMNHAVINELQSKKLTNEIVLKIRSDNRKQIEISKEYNVSYQTISEIKLRKTWKLI